MTLERGIFIILIMVVIVYRTYNTLFASQTLPLVTEPVHSCTIFTPLWSIQHCIHFGARYFSYILPSMSYQIIRTCIHLHLSEVKYIAQGHNISKQLCPSIERNIIFLCKSYIKRVSSSHGSTHCTIVPRPSWHWNEYFSVSITIGCLLFCIISANKSWV